MPQSLAKVIIHTVFSTKNRAPYLQDASIRDELYAYMATALKSLDSPAILIGGVADHMHVLSLLSRNHPIKKIVEEIKTSSSKWIKTKGPNYRGFYWQSGYGVFSVSESKIPAVKRYIAGQEKHHRKMSFQDEFRIICKKHDIEIDGRYVWD